MHIGVDLDNTILDATSAYLLSLTENKLQACINSQVDVLIDDAPHYAEQFALMNKPIILYEQPYNLSITHDLVFRASNWAEVKKHIDHLESDKHKMNVSS